MSVVFIGVGSNLGDRCRNINRAFHYLRITEGIEIEKVSSLEETNPEGGPGPKYLNAVLKIRTELSPTQLLLVLKRIEKNLGRKRSFKNAPRTIDLDILLYDDLIVNETELKIPHPRMFEREFVLRPLFEIEPKVKRLVKRLKTKIKLKL